MIGKVGRLRATYPTGGLFHRRAGTDSMVLQLLSHLRLHCYIFNCYTRRLNEA